MKLYLIDINLNLIKAWENEFNSYKNIKIIHGSIFEFNADAIVSPANSFGIMDGGIDGKIRDFFGMNIEQKVRNKIIHDFKGELPVGCAITTETDNKQFKYLISAPTMRVPEIVKDSLNAYLAMRAILIECNKNNILTVAIPGLCSLSGGMPYNIVARQMRVAYDRICLKSINYSHWREEKYLQDYLMCKTNTLPIDLE